MVKRTSISCCMRRGPDSKCSGTPKLQLQLQRCPHIPENVAPRRRLGPVSSTVAFNVRGGSTCLTAETFPGGELAGSAAHSLPASLIEWNLAEELASLAFFFCRQLASFTTSLRQQHANITTRLDKQLFYCPRLRSILTCANACPTFSEPLPQYLTILKTITQEHLQPPSLIPTPRAREQSRQKRRQATLISTIFV